MNARVRAALLIGVIAAGLPTEAAPAVEPDHRPDQPDCGVIALFNLLTLAGRTVSLDEVVAALPAPNPRGYSLEELRAASARLGLEVEGVRLRSRATPPDRPMLAYVNASEHGHFLVVRPVGHTGKLIQVLDGLRPPDVLDGPLLFRSPGWTGLGLVPSRPEWAARLGVIAAAALAVPVTARLVRRRRAA